MESIKQILSENIIGTLATINEDGSPWATPVHIFADDTALYWFSQEDHQHSQNIVRDSRVSIALWSRNEGTKGAYVSSNAELLNAADAAYTQQIVEQALGVIPPVFKNTSAYRVVLGQINSSKSSEKRWYFYT